MASAGSGYLECPLINWVKSFLTTHSLIRCSKVLYFALVLLRPSQQIFRHVGSFPITIRADYTQNMRQSILFFAKTLHHFFELDC